MGEGDFEAVHIPDEINFQMRTVTRQMFEFFEARFDDRRLQPGHGFALEARSIGKKAGYTACRRSQANVGIHRHVQVFRFSGHGC